MCQKILTTVLYIISVMLMQSCALTSSLLGSKDAAHEAVSVSEKDSQAIKPLALQDRIAWPESAAVLPAVTAEKLYTFATKDISLEQALKLFAQAYKLNIIVHPDVKGTINVNFHDLPFAQAMSALLNSHGYYWEKQGELIHVRSVETRVFNVDYIRLVRSGSGSSQAQISSSSSESGSGSGDSDETAGAMKIEQVDKVDFWVELEEQLKVLVSESGRLVVNRLAGTVQVTDQHKRVDEIGKYIQQLNRSIFRQVDIEVKIIEVTLNDDFSLGINWERIAPTALTPGNSRGFEIRNIVGQPAGGITALSPSLSFTGIQRDQNGLRKFEGVVEALKEQGEVNIVSQPRIRTLNNQSALIKVGTDRTFFRKETQKDSTTVNQEVTTTDLPQVVTEGIVLAITPQISMNGWITMDISPVVTRVSSVVEVKNNEGVVESTAPNLDISQASSLVRARNGETIVIGGLIQKQKIDTTRGIPWLHRVPGLGYLFKGNYQSDVQRELVMFVTPRLISQKPILAVEEKLQ